MRRPCVFRAPASTLAAGVALLAVSGGAAAQATADTAAPVTGCYRLAFGTWTPTLDWRAAGHGWGPGSVRPKTDYPGGGGDASSRERAPAAGGPASWEASRSDSVLVLYPPWWPVGIVVHLAAPLLAPSDTVSGVATAFVADAGVASPTATVRAWRGRCRP